VAGTHGKTTTTSLAGLVLTEAGFDPTIVVGGRVRILGTNARLGKGQYLVAEADEYDRSFLELTPVVAVITNVEADHLDTYRDLNEIVDAFAAFANRVAFYGAVIGCADDPGAVRVLQRVKRRVVTYGESAEANLRARGIQPDPAGTTFEVWEGDRWLLGTVRLAIAGRHNVANALAASLAAMIADESHRTASAREKIAEGLRTFQALKHRMEPVGEYGGVLWINDSKATNVSSTLVALEGMTRPYVLLLGGRHKGEPYTALAEPFRRKGKVILAYGEAGPIVEQDLGGLVPVERLGSSFEDVMTRARELTAPGDAVLLSPACSSYDMFRNYEERGADFRRLAAQRKQ
jgi:UDP-N-acetylmuramoylalanine--D-glutamate ligase